jgi:hypothetical protein
MFLLPCDVAFEPTLTQPPAVAQMAVEETWEVVTSGGESCVLMSFITVIIDRYH